MIKTPKKSEQEQILTIFYFPDPSPLALVGKSENTSHTCVSHTENSLKKITLVNCLIIIILIIVIAANINEGQYYCIIENKLHLKA